MFGVSDAAWPKTNASVAISVELSFAAAVGATGTPVNAGEFSSATLGVLPVPDTNPAADCKGICATGEPPRNPAGPSALQPLLSVRPVLSSIQGVAAALKSF